MTNEITIHEGLVNTVVEGSTVKPTDDIEAVRAELIARGWKPVSEKPDGYGMEQRWERRPGNVQSR